MEILSKSSEIKIQELIHDWISFKLEIPKKVWVRIIKTNPCINEFKENFLNDEDITEKEIKGTGIIRNYIGYTSVYEIPFKKEKWLYFNFNSQNKKFEKEWNKIKKHENISFEIVYIICFWKFIFDLVDECLQSIKSIELFNFNFSTGDSFDSKEIDNKYIYEYKEYKFEKYNNKLNKTMEYLKNYLDVYPEDYNENELPIIKIPILVQEIDDPKIYEIYNKFKKTKTVEEMQDEIMLLWKRHLESQSKNIKKINQSCNHKTFTFDELEAKMNIYGIRHPEPFNKNPKNTYLQNWYKLLKNEKQAKFKLKQLFWKCLIALLCLKNTPKGGD